MSENIKIRVQITDDGSFKQLTINGDEFKKVIGEITSATNELNGEFVQTASKIQIFESITSVIGQLQSVCSELTSAYTVQSSAETRLAQAMQNTMGATLEEINSIKELCSAQQQLGIIGDEVQLSGAQELATYLTMSSSLKTLIPVMNDMVAQQYGFNASAESATQIASMLGKVMNGQTEALSRYGYKFDEAQKYILKYGDEEERVAVLAEVVSEAVGGMNESMAQTPEGHLAQWNNKLGDLKELAGQAAVKIQGFLQASAGISNTVIAVSKMTEAWKVLNATQIISNKIMKLTKLSISIIRSSSLAAALGINVTTASVTALNVALSVGVIGLVAALATGLMYLFSSSEKASDGLDEVNDATKAYSDAAAEAKIEIAKEITELEDLIKKKSDTAEKVAELNEKYGESFGYYQTAAEWYDILINKSSAYCKQLATEAAAKVAAQSYGEALSAVDVARDNVNNFNGATQATGWISKDNPNGYNPEYKKLLEARENAEKEAAKRKRIYETAIDRNNAAQQDFKNSVGTSVIDWNNATISQLNTEISKQQEILKNQKDINSQDAQNAKASLANLTKIKKEKEKALGLNTTTSTSSNTKKDKYDGSSEIENAKTYKELGNNIKFYENALDSADIADKEHIVSLAKLIAEAKKQQQAIKDARDAAMLEANKPTSPQSLEEVKSLKQIDDAIEYQKKLSVGASAEKMKACNDEIKRLQELREAFEDSTHVELADEQIKNFKQLQSEIDFYSRKLQTADAEERKIIQGKINHLQELQKQWQRVLEQLNRPGDISTLNTIEDLDDAITYFTALQKSSSQEEALGYQKTIDALTRKKEAMESILSLPKMQREVGELGNLNGVDLDVRLHLIGLEEIQAKIRTLQAMLNNTENPLGEKERDEVKKLIATYKNYEAELKRSDASVVEGWQNIKGITGGVESLSEALKDDEHGWKKISRVVDSVIQIYHSFASVVEIMKALTGATEVQSAATAALGDAKMVEAAKDASATRQVVSDSAEKTGAKLVETNANIASSASGYMSSHSEIPFVGFAIGAAFVAAMIALMLSLPKFAEGGIAYGPTLGIFGEYSGASTNPEVVAPLNKLRDLIGNEGMSGRVVFKINGRTLVGILEKEAQYKSRTRS